MLVVEYRAGVRHGGAEEVGVELVGHVVVEADGFRIGLFGVRHQATLDAGELARALGGGHRRLLEAVTQNAGGYAGNGCGSERANVFGQRHQLAHRRIRVGVVNAVHVEIAQNVCAHDADFIRVREQLVHAVRRGDFDLQIRVCRAEMRAVESVDTNGSGGVEKQGRHLADRHSLAICH